MPIKFGQLFASVTGREVSDHDGLSDIEVAVENTLHRKLSLVRSTSNVITPRGNIFRYSTGELNGIDSRIDSLLPSIR